MKSPSPSGKYKHGSACSATPFLTIRACEQRTALSVTLWRRVLPPPHASSTHPVISVRLGAVCEPPAGLPCWAAEPAGQVASLRAPEPPGAQAGPEEAVAPATWGLLATPMAVGEALRARGPGSLLFLHLPSGKSSPGTASGRAGPGEEDAGAPPALWADVGAPGCKAGLRCPSRRLPAPSLLL